MTNRRTKVDTRIAGDGDRNVRPEFADRVGTGLKLESRCHPVPEFEFLPEWSPRMAMNIDKAWRNDKTAGIDRRRALHCRSRNCCDISTDDTDVSDRIESRFGIDNPAADKNDVVLHGLAFRIARNTATCDNSRAKCEQHKKGGESPL